MAAGIATPYYLWLLGRLEALAVTGTIVPAVFLALPGGRGFLSVPS